MQICVGNNLQMPMLMALTALTCASRRQSAKGWMQIQQSHYYTSCWAGFPTVDTYSLVCFPISSADTFWWIYLAHFCFASWDVLEFIVPWFCCWRWSSSLDTSLALSYFQFLLPSPLDDIWLLILAKYCYIFGAHFLI